MTEFFNDIDTADRSSSFPFSNGAMPAASFSGGIQPPLVQADNYITDDIQLRNAPVAEIPFEKPKNLDFFRKKVTSKRNEACINDESKIEETLIDHVTLPEMMFIDPRYAEPYVKNPFSSHPPEHQQPGGRY